MIGGQEATRGLEGEMREGVEEEKWKEEQWKEEQELKTHH